MSKQIRNLGIFFLVCYLAVFVQLNRLAYLDAEDVRDDPRNNRAVVRNFGGPRGSIATQDGELVARSVPTDTEYQRRREYPHGELYAHLTGYFSLRIGSTGLEQEYNEELAGNALGELNAENVSDYFLDDERVGNLTLTVRHDLQQLAREQLGERRGSVVALNPRTGGILAMYSNPTFDPNPLSSHQFTKAEQLSNCFNEVIVPEGEEPEPDDVRCPNDPEQTIGDTPLVARDDNPLLARTFRETYFPGSTFKVVTATAGLESGDVTTENPVYDEVTAYEPPIGQPIQNFGGHQCGGNLLQIIADSCNSSFAQMAVDTGPELMQQAAENFGFNSPVPIDLPGAAASNFPAATDFMEPGSGRITDPALLGQSGIGQYEVRATPLQMALVAAAVANEGEVPEPHVVADVRNEDGGLIETIDPGAWRRAMDGDQAAILRQGMLGVVSDGTASSTMQLPGIEVGAKTGTAQLGTDPPTSHAWVIAFAGEEGQAPEVAVAVVVERVDGADDSTGGRVAGPIAAQMITSALADPQPSQQQEPPPGGD